MLKVKAAINFYENAKDLSKERSSAIIFTNCKGIQHYLKKVLLRVSQATYLTVRQKKVFRVQKQNQQTIIQRITDFEGRDKVNYRYNKFLHFPGAHLS